MNEDVKSRRRFILQICTISILVLVCACMGVYFHVVLHMDVIYTHFAYVPIILACMWWGRKGILVAILLMLIFLSTHLLGLGTERLLNDAVRLLFFFIVAICVAMLSEKVTASQKALALSEAKHRLLVEKSLTGIFVYRDEQILFANSRFAQMLGYPLQTMIGMNIWQLFHEQDRPRVQQLVQRRKIEGFTDLHYECRLIRADGKVIWADIASSVAQYEGVPATLVNVYDITEKKEAEEKRRELSDLARKQEEQLIHSTRLAELGEMAAAVAHELNQPLTGIRNFARNAFYMLEKNVGSLDDVKNNLRLISEQVDRASKIINQMRELTRKTEHQFTQVDINSTMREAVEFLMPQFRLAGVEVTLELAPDLPPVLGDRIRLEQVFLNLLTNARQAMEESSIRRLLVKSWVNHGADLPVVVEVIDTGKGFTSEIAAKLFRPFFSTKKPGQGTGLGLSISMSIIKDHKGTIEAQGEPGKGAKFTIRLPVGTQPEPQATLTTDEIRYDK